MPVLQSHLAQRLEYQKMVLVLAVATQVVTKSKRASGEGCPPGKYRLGQLYHRLGTCASKFSSTPALNRWCPDNFADPVNAHDVPQALYNLLMVWCRKAGGRLLQWRMSIDKGGYCSC